VRASGMAEVLQEPVNQFYGVRDCAFRDPAGNEGTSEVSVTVLNTTPTLTYDIPPRGGAAFTTSDSGDSLIVSHARFQSNAQGAAGLAGLAMMDLHANGILVTESSIPAVSPVFGGRVPVDVGGPVTTGIAFSNPSPQDAVIQFYFTDTFGTNFGSGSLTLAPRQQLYQYLDKQPFAAPSPMRGTFTFIASIPIGAIALNGFTNERGDFIATVIPVAAFKTQRTPLVLPEFVDGGGWSTRLTLTNTSDSPESGTVEFVGQGSENQSAVRLAMSASGLTGETFYYWLPPRTAAALTTTGNSGLQIGSARVISSANSVNASAVLFLQSRGVTVSTTSLPLMEPGVAFQSYVETAGAPGDAGSIQAGIAIANTSFDPVQVSIQLTDLDGDSVASPTANVNLAGSGQRTLFINQLFPGLPAEFQGIVRVTAPSAVTVASLRAKYNERNDLLMTASPVLNEGKGSASDLIFPHIVQGAGWSTELILFGQPGSGKVYLYSQDGAPGSSSDLSVAH